MLFLDGNQTLRLLNALYASKLLAFSSGDITVVSVEE
jgi:hypothetical protein